MAPTSVYTGQSNASSTASSNFDTVYQKLTKDRPFPVLPSPSANPHDPQMSNEIAELYVHPTLESLLHILNNDLPSAHFLCRHMQSKPAYEAMYIHGLLHRIEGDYRNAEAWYGDVADSDAFKHVWSEHGGLEGGKDFIRRIEKLRKEKSGDLESLQAESKREIEGLIEFCRQKFGVEKMLDATQAWIDNSEKISEQASKMLVGGEGWRQF
ncbi:hypothetical protein MRB53_039360 [Persea americana]|nr:hypothetical protein MRB53_039360 [Persea americana]